MTVNPVKLSCQSRCAPDGPPCRCHLELWSSPTASQPQAGTPPLSSSPKRSKLGELANEGQWQSHEASAGLVLGLTEHLYS